MRVLVTGGSGFIGQHLIRGLTSTGAVSEIISLDTVPLLPIDTGDVSLRSITGDVRDQETCEQAARGMDSIIHLAAVASVPASIEDPRTTHETNATGTLNVLEAARSNAVSHVTVASSSAVYGEHPEPRKHEELPVQFLSPYAASKGATEGYALTYGATYSLPTVAFRFFNVFGPGQTADHPYAAVIPRFLHAIRNNEPLTVFGDGEQTRDFVSVHTVVDALIKASMRRLSSTTPVNIASGRSISLNALVAALEEIHGSPLDVQYQEERLGDIRHSGASVNVLESLIPDLSWSDFIDSLHQVYSWYLSL